MRLLFASNFVRNPDSGAAGSIEAIGNALQRRGHEVAYLWSHSRPYRLPVPRLAEFVELPGRLLAAVAGRLAAAAFDVVMISQPYAYKAFERLRPQYPRTLFVNRTHGWEERVYDATLRFEWNNGGAGRWRALAGQRLARVAARRVVQSSHGIVAASRLCAEYIRSHHSVPPWRVRAIGYGVDGPGPPRSKPSRSDELRLIYVGNFLALKGARAIEALARNVLPAYPSVRLTLVVQHEAVPALRTAIQPLLGPRLEVIGWVSRHHLNEILAEQDVLLFPPIFEGFGKAFLEAMAAGLCVIGYAEGGLPDVAIAGETALFCPPGQQEQFEQLVRSALADPTLVRHIGLAAKARVAGITWDTVAVETEAFCKDLIGAWRL